MITATRHFTLFFLAVVLATPALSETVKYYDDPVYEKMAEEDVHPMADLIHLAENNDARAQFILADLYAKGKGGLPKDRSLAETWFEKSARSGYSFGFIRLAALAKAAQNPAQAYTWYTLGIEHLHGKNRRYAIQARTALLEKSALDKNQLKAAKKAVELWKKNARDKKQAAAVKKAVDKEAIATQESADPEKAAEKPIVKKPEKTVAKKPEKAGKETEEKTTKTTLEKTDIKTTPSAKEEKNYNG